MKMSLHVGDRIVVCAKNFISTGVPAGTRGTIRSITKDPKQKVCRVRGAKFAIAIQETPTTGFICTELDIQRA